MKRSERSPSFLSLLFCLLPEHFFFYTLVDESLEKGENVSLKGFGSFIVKKRTEKTARNISKKTIVIVPAYNIPAFKPAKELTNQVNKLKD